MSRVQLALNVPDIDAAVAFYSKLFATEPAQAQARLRQLRHRRSAAQVGPVRERRRDSRLNHLGVEVCLHRRRRRRARPASLRRADAIEENGTCCFAKQDKVWVDGPDGAWEIYTVIEDSDSFGVSSTHVDDQGDSLCCASVPEAEARCC